MLEIEEYAKQYNVPIMQKEGINYLKKFIKDNNIKTILEIGTAIGYSAINMALVDKNIKIITIERDIERYNESLKNIKKFNLFNQINVINDDAFNVDISEKFDLIFIDAAKAQNIKFFEKFTPNLNDEGYVITDNLNFHGLVNSNIKMSRNLKQLTRKIQNYINYLKENKNFQTQFFYNIGDGISVSKKMKH